MAFLDNSGDIILDAVLTDLGRKRMAEGNFRITQFALGDDEIDYSLYDLTNASGSSYYDLEILQTPVLEAFTSKNANINYGLISLSPNILYMPSLKFNEKENLNGNVATVDDIFWLAAYPDEAINTSTLPSSLNAQSKFLTSGDPSKFAMFETGLDSTEVPANRGNRNSYIIQNDLLDREFYVSYDSSIFSGVHSVNGGIFSRTETEQNATLKLDITSDLLANQNISQVGLEMYKTSRLNGFDNLVYQKTGATSDTDISNIQGVRATFSGLAFTVQASLANNPSDFLYTRYGKVNETVGGVNISYVDTVVYIQGVTTGVTGQLRLRVFKKY